MQPIALLVTLVLMVSLRLAEGAESPFFVDEQGVALRGYDPVAYFVLKQPVKGNSSYSVHWSGATWWFDNDENRALFEAAPEQYAPQYGGWCSMAMAGGRVVEVDLVGAWNISGGKLYFNVNKSVQQRWLRGQNRLLRKADERWPDTREAILADRANIVRKRDLPSWY